MPVNLENVITPMLLDTGAAVSVFPEQKLQMMLTQPLHNFVNFHSAPTQTIMAFGGRYVIVEGPYALTVKLLDLSFKHDFYLLDADTPFIAGFDFIVKARLVIDPVRRLVWSQCSETNSVTCDRTEQETLVKSVIDDDDGVRNFHEQLCQPNGSANDECVAEVLSHPRCFNSSETNTVTLSRSTVYESTNDHSSGIDDLTSIDLPDHLQVLFCTTVERSHLTFDIVSDFKQLLLDHEATFAKSSDDLGFCPLLQHDIDTGDAKPIRQPPRRPPLASGRAEDDLVDEMLVAGVIEPSDSPWASPVCLVRKPDGKYRFRVDYRKVNAVSKQDAFSIPDIRDALDSLRGARHYATIDLLSGYRQLGMTQRAKERSAFCTQRGLFQFNRMPFQLCGAPASFCRLMLRVLRGHLWNICLFYFDDVIILERPRESYRNGSIPFLPVWVRLD